MSRKDGLNKITLWPFDLRVVRVIESRQLSEDVAQRKYGIQGNATVLTWLRKHGRTDRTPTNELKEKSRPQLQDS